MPPPRPSIFRPDRLWRSAREPLIWLDSDLRVVWVNTAWEDLTGHKAESIVGAVCSAFGPSEAGDVADLAASFAPPPEALGGRPTTTSTLLVRPDGERLLRALTFWPFIDRDGSLLGMLGQVRDAEERAAATESRGHRLRVRLLALRNALHERYGFDSLLGEGSAHRRLLGQVRLAASTGAPVLIVGEPGTGKRHVARVIHGLGGDASTPLTAFDCEALPAEALERELFVAKADHDNGRSRLAQAEGSTLLLGDVLSLPRDLQARLVDALDVGGGPRLLAVTSGDPEAAVRSERLRADLYHALSVLTIRLLPLRERQGEILLLAQHFLEQANRRGERQRSGFTPAAEWALSSYDWPGNLRELARVVEHAHAQGTDQGDRGAMSDPVDANDLPAEIRGNLGAAYSPPRTAAPPKPLDELLTDVERRLIENAMAKARRNKSRAAELLGVSRPRLYRRIKELNLPDEPGEES